jgi:GNAT superfamily N-acetyltransferase
VCGNVLVIDTEEPAEPELAPWIAAVWIDENSRGRGAARAMIEEAAGLAAALHVPRLYLLSRRPLRELYTRLGRRELESGVGEHRQVLYARDPGAVPSPP